MGGNLLLLLLLVGDDGGGSSNWGGEEQAAASIEADRCSESSGTGIICRSEKIMGKLPLETRADRRGSDAKVQGNLPDEAMEVSSETS